MKYMIISDIHGDIDKLNAVIDIYRQENCSKLLILGDLFNYGIDYNRDDIVNRLNMLKDNIIAVRGNCDYNISDILFDMPYKNEVNLNNKKIIMSHGHIYDTKYLLNTDAEIICMGHSHIPSIEKVNGKLIINPGSISKSRRGENSFIIVSETSITIRNLYNDILKKY